jgi:hypothetical protein
MPFGNDDSICFGGGNCPLWYIIVQNRVGSLTAVTSRVHNSCHLYARTEYKMVSSADSKNGKTVMLSYHHPIEFFIVFHWNWLYLIKNDCIWLKMIYCIWLKRIDWLCDWLIVRLIGRLNDWLFDWLIDWLSDWFRFQSNTIILNQVQSHTGFIQLYTY